MRRVLRISVEKLQQVLAGEVSFVQEDFPKDFEVYRVSVDHSGLTALLHVRSKEWDRNAEMLFRPREVPVRNLSIDDDRSASESRTSISPRG